MSIFVHGPFPDPDEDPLPGGVHRAIEHVRERWRHALEPVTADELASADSVSRGHLSRLFREHVGVGPVAAFERLRLARAAGVGGGRLPFRAERGPQPCGDLEATMYDRLAISRSRTRCRFRWTGAATRMIGDGLKPLRRLVPRVSAEVPSSWR
jgi:hypothetical protein